MSPDSETVLEDVKSIKIIYTKAWIKDGYQVLKNQEQTDGLNKQTWKRVTTCGHNTVLRFSLQQ